MRWSRRSGKARGLFHHRRGSFHLPEPWSLQAGHGGRRPVDGIVELPLIVVRNELVEVVVLGGFGIDSPEQEGSDRVAAHEAVEEPLDLMRVPHELR